MPRLAVLVGCAVVLIAGAAAPAWCYTQSQFDAVTSEEEAQINRVRDQEINQLKIVMGRHFAESRRPDILLRLAELYVEKYRFFFFKENQIHQDLYKKGVKEKSVNHDRSREQLRGATGACLAILKSRVPFQKLDEVYYFLGYNAEELGKRSEAAKYFGVVAKRYPNSNYAPEAFRNLAENAFEHKKFAQAVQYYERAAQFTKMPSYPRTLYKLAWAYFKTRRKADALSTMKRVIEISGKEDKFVGLRDEALGDIVLFFSEAGKLNEAHNYFSGISGGAEVYVRALTKLARVYEGRGEMRLALKVNQTLLDTYGDNRPDLVFDALAKNVELYRRLSDAGGEESALRKLVEFFASHGDDIAHGKGEEVEATYARTKNYLRGRATEVHKEARKKNSPKLFVRAADLYGLYVKAFLSKPSNEKEERERAEIDAYRSDALLAAGREAEAMPELERTLVQKGDAKLRREAGTTLLNLVIKRLDAARTKGKDDPAVEAQFLRVAAEFEEAFPDDKLVVELRYKRARLAAAKSGPDGLNSDARNALEELVEKYPSRPEAAAAAHDLVDDLIKRKKQDDALELARTYLANAPLIRASKGGELERFLRSIVERKSFTDVSEKEKEATNSDEFARAAAEYERLGDTSKDAEVGSKALNNAAVNFDRAGNTDEAVRVYLKMLAKQPSNRQPLEELKRLAAQSLWKSRFSQAARLYARLATMDAYSRDERMSSVHTALILEWDSGNLPNAFLIGSRGLRELCDASAARASVRKGKKPSTKAREREARRRGDDVSAGARRRAGGWDLSCHDLALSLAQLQIEAGHPQEAAGALRGYLARKVAGIRRAEANFMLGSLYRQIHESRKAAVYYEEAANAVKRAKDQSSSADRRERNFAAHAAFLLVEPYFTEFAALKLTLPEETLKTATRKKLRDLDGLVTRYSNVVAYGDGEWGIAALERLYDIFTAFASELDRAPVPPRIQGPQLEAYRRGIESVARPMAARGLDYLKQGFKKGIQLGVTTPTFLALTQRLARHSPREYPAAHYAMASGTEDSGADLKSSRRSSLRLVGAAQAADAGDLRRMDHPWRTQVAAKLAQNPKAVDSWIEFGNLEAMSGRLKLAKLMYEQALALAPRNAMALCDLSVVLFLENRAVEATQGFGQAAESAEFNKDVKLNLAKSLLAFHHFGPALEHLRSLAARLPEDREVQEALAVALLGSGQLAPAGAKLEELDADGSKRFDLWYNWSVWAILSGQEGQKEKAMELLKDRREGLGPVEKAQVELLQPMVAGGAGK